MSKRMPVLFVGHGSPMNALAKNAYSEHLRKLAQKLPRPKAILCVSAHWETQGSQVLYQAEPKTIHDFYGFPKNLFEIQYPARGPLDIAHRTQKLIPQSQLNETWGLDHGTWSVLIHMYPHADIPVFQLSLDLHKSPQQHFDTGKILQPLRSEGVLILGSGNIVHNLSRITWKEPTFAHEWNINFDLKIKAALENRNNNELVQYENLDKDAKLAVPSPEHYLPLLYCAGASLESDQVSFPYEGYELGGLSMRSVLWS